MSVRLPDAQRPLFEKLVPMTVEVRKLSKDGEGCGAGVVITSGGLILTCYHVVTRSRVMRVRRLHLDRKRWVVWSYGSYKADVVFRDKRADLAVLKLRKPPPDLDVAEIGDADALKIGDDAVFRVGRDKVPLACGYLLGRGSFRKHIPQLSAGMDAAPGSSGGPLFDDEGKLVGLCLQYQSKESLPPIAYAIPIGTVTKRLFWRQEVKQYLSDPPFGDG
jgi:serine protease Do